MILNVHNSLLPDYRGLHAFSWAIEFGERRLGYTLHKVSADVDAGQILAQTEFDLPLDCDVNCAFRVGLQTLEEWLPMTLEKLIRHELPEHPKTVVPRENPHELFKRRSGPYVLTGEFDMKRLKNALRASNPPYAQGLVFHRDDNQQKVYLLPFSRECREWVSRQESELLVETVPCADGSLIVNSIVIDSVRQINP
jgi:methionyl-tRNA formyltransferase